MLERQPEEASLTVALAIYAQRLSVSFGSLNKHHFQCKQFKRKRFGVQAQLAREGSNCRAVLGCTHAGLADLFLAMINKIFDLTQSSVPAPFRDYHCKGPTCITSRCSHQSLSMLNLKKSAFETVKMGFVFTKRLWAPVKPAIISQTNRKVQTTDFPFRLWSGIWQAGSICS